MSGVFENRTIVCKTWLALRAPQLVLSVARNTYCRLGVTFTSTLTVCPVRETSSLEERPSGTSGSAPPQGNSVDEKG